MNRSGWIWAISFLTIILFFHSIGAFASEDEAERSMTLDEIVVTGTKTEKTIIESPVSISVITEEEIEKTPALTIDEAMQFVPGSFHWKRTGLSEPHPFVLMRGFQSSSRNLSLIDGMKLNYPPYSSINWMSVPLVVVDRIEQVRGPFSSLYGGSAMGGVVNIMTKTPTELELRAKASYATYDSMVGQVLYGDRFMDRLSVLLAYEGRKTDGYPSRFITKSGTSDEEGVPVKGWKHTRDVTDSKDLYILGDRGDENNEEHLFYGKLAFDINPRNRLSFSVNHHDKEFERDDYDSWLRDEDGNLVDSGTVSFLDQTITVAPGTFLMGTGNSSREQTRYIAKYEGALSDSISMEFMLGMNDTPESISNTPSTSATNSGGPGRISETDSEGIVASAKVNFPLGERNYFTAGADWEQNKSENVYYTLSDWTDPNSKTAFENSSKGKIENWGFYVQDEISLHEKLTAYVGGRYDVYSVSDGEVVLTEPEFSRTTYDDNTESQFSPKLSLHFRPFSDTVIRGSAGTSFRGPLISELYKKSYHNPDIWSYGNPNLEPETATSWEIGFVQSFFGRKSHLSATYFESYVDDMINDVPITIDPETNRVVEKQSENIGKVEIKGVEAEVRHMFTDYLTGFANFTWTDAITKEHPTDKASEGKQLSLIPEYMCNAGLYFSMHGFEASLLGKYVSKIYSRSDNEDDAEGVPSSYEELFLVDMKVGYRFNQYVKTSVAVTDLFDEEPFYNYLMPGRRITGTVELSF